MVDHTSPLPGLSPVTGKPVIGRFDGGRLSSDGGLLVLREMAKRLRFTDRVAACIEDPRDPTRTVRSLADIIGFLWKVALHGRRRKATHQTLVIASVMGRWQSSLRTRRGTRPVTP
ncbi:transposase [Azospirillum sp. A1-3]|uniref:transposase n=1 Tax=Azospirillum sp. A1-3 TaxID=185874 RepID=UPI002572E651|nr:transposase [Azospirillum sp. A1-3]